MLTAVTFEITLRESESIIHIADQLKNLNLKVLEYSAQEMGRETIPNRLMCTSLFPDTDALELALAQKSNLGNIGGVKKVEIVHYMKQKEKGKWYDHFMIPILLLVCVEALTIFGILVGLNVKEVEKYLLVIIIPAITTFFSAVAIYRWRTH